MRLMWAKSSERDSQTRHHFVVFCVLLSPIAATQLNTSFVFCFYRIIYACKFETNSFVQWHSCLPSPRVSLSVSLSLTRRAAVGDDLSSTAVLLDYNCARRRRHHRRRRVVTQWCSADRGCCKLCSCCVSVVVTVRPRSQRLRKLSRHCYSSFRRHHTAFYDCFQLVFGILLSVFLFV